MAENLDDGEFWLPSQFLTDDDSTLVLVNDNNGRKKSNLPAFFNSGNDDVSREMFGYLSCPLESSETESSDEEEQHMAELTRRVAQTSLGLDLSHQQHRLSIPPQKPKGVGVSGSPQSTLCGCGGSPNGACHVTSQRATWDLLRAAAGEVERMRLIEAERRRFAQNHHHSLVVPPRNPAVAGFNAYHERQQLRIAQFEMLRQQQMAKQQGSVPAWCGAQSRVMNGDADSVVGGGRRNTVRGGNEGLCASAWPPLQHHYPTKQQQRQQHYDSGMRAVFIGNPSGKRESTGTGVFLPRPVESKKKPACSTVLVPARVVQALNLKIGDMVQQTHHQPRFSGIPNTENASGVQRGRSNYGLAQQKRNNMRTQPQVMNHEIRLPQEWSY